MIKENVKSCIHCDKPLYLGLNWEKSQQKQGKYWCTPCKREHNKKRMYVNGKYISFNHPLYKAGRYKSFNDLAFQSLKSYTTVKEGFVYVIRNKAWDGWVKIGMAIDAEDRLNSYQTSSPFRDYELVYSKYFNDRKVAEKKCHRIAKKKSVEYESEWFFLPEEEAIKIIEEVYLASI